jgi:hypothetical protein
MQQHDRRPTWVEELGHRDLDPARGDGSLATG